MDVKIDRENREMSFVVIGKDGSVKVRVIERLKRQNVVSEALTQTILFLVRITGPLSRTFQLTETSFPP